MLSHEEKEWRSARGHCCGRWGGRRGLERCGLHRLRTAARATLPRQSNLRLCTGGNGGLQPTAFFHHRRPHLLIVSTLGPKCRGFVALFWPQCWSDNFFRFRNSRDEDWGFGAQFIEMQWKVLGLRSEIARNMADFGPIVAKSRRNRLKAGLPRSSGHSRLRQHGWCGGRNRIARGRGRCSGGSILRGQHLRRATVAGHSRAGQTASGRPRH